VPLVRASFVAMLCTSCVRLLSMVIWRGLSWNLLVLAYASFIVGVGVVEGGCMDGMLGLLCHWTIL